MNFNKIFLFLIIIFVVTNCSNTTQISIKKDNLIIENQYSNKGFALIYNEGLYKDKSISKNLIIIIFNISEIKKIIIKSQI